MGNVLLIQGFEELGNGGRPFLPGLDIPQVPTSFRAERPVGAVPELRVVACPMTSL